MSRPDDSDTGAPQAGSSAAPASGQQPARTGESDVIPAEIEAEIESLPEDVRPTIRRIAAYFSGPIPPPGHLAQYESIVPGSAKRMIGLAEKAMAHRHDIERTIVNAQISDAVADRIERKRGQVFGLIIGLTTIIAGAGTAIYGYPFAGGVIGTSGVAGLVSVFVIGRRAGKQGEKEAPTTSAPGGGN